MPDDANGKVVKLNVRDIAIIVSLLMNLVAVAIGASRIEARVGAMSERVQLQTQALGEMKATIDMQGRQVNTNDGRLRVLEDRVLRQPRRENEP